MFIAFEVQLVGKNAASEGERRNNRVIHVDADHAIVRLNETTQVLHI